MRPRFNQAALADLERRRELKEAAYRRKQRGKWQGHDLRHQHTPPYGWILNVFELDFKLQCFHSQGIWCKDAN